MALRDRIFDRVKPHVPPGETLEAAFPAQGGPSPWWTVVTILIVLFGAKYRVIAVTDKHVHLYKQSLWKLGQPKELLASFPAGTPLQASDAVLWSTLELGSERLWVHRRFKADVERANAASQASLR